MDHHLTKLVNIIESSLCENRMNKSSGSEVKPSCRESQLKIPLYFTSKQAKDTTYASSTSFKVPVTLPTMFKRFNAS